MYINNRQANAISRAVFLIGLGVLFYTRFWWPGILFLLGTTGLVQGLVRGRGWYAFQASFWLFAIGFLALFHFGLPLLFVCLGVGVLINAFARPSIVKRKPRPNDLLE